MTWHLAHDPAIATKNKIRDAVLRKRAGLPVLDDEADLLEQALDLIETLERRPQYAAG